jgi:glycosyltransferase involved in cell wall biosynthesis
LPHGVQLLIVDSKSTDRTPEIARAAGARVIDREWRGFVDARAFALAAVNTPWTFMLDADEELDETLREAMLDASGDVDGYTVARTTFFAGRPMRIWSGERIVRLFRTGAARLRSKAMSDAAEVHEVWTIPGPVGALPGVLRHYSYDGVTSYRAKFEHYSDLEAAAVRPSAFRAFTERLKAMARFLYLLVGRGALLDGPRGVYVAWWSALYPAVVMQKARKRL